MKKLIMFVAAALLAEIALSGVTIHFALDCREGTRTVSADGEELYYDASWYTNADSIRLSKNGTVVETGTNGAYHWQLEPSCTSRYVFKLEAFNGNQVVTNETAEFVNNKPTLDHTGAITKPAVEPTSSQPGMAAEITCSRCGEVLQTATVIPALGYIRNVTARQLWPHKKVEVSYEIAEDIVEVANEKAALNLTGKYGSKTKTAANLVGDKTCTPGLHRIVWDFEKDSIAINQSSMTFTVGYASVIGTSVGVTVNTSSSVKDGMAVAGTMTLGYSPIDAREVELQIDGTTVLSSEVYG